MKYQLEIIINRPLDDVVALFDNQENMSKWQPELKSIEPISGEPGQVGARTKLQYKMGKRNVEMIETITKKNLPDELEGSYEARGVFNIMNNRFEKIDKNSTRWLTISDFRFKGMMAFVFPLMKSAFKKQTRKSMKQFKSFAETGA